MVKDVMNYDPLAPTPHCQPRCDDPKPVPRARQVQSLGETVDAELALKRQKDDDLTKRHAEAKERWRIERQATEWSYGWETEKLRIQGATLDQEFRRSAIDTSAPKSPRVQPDQEKTTGWRQSAREQVHILREWEDAFERHDVIWRIREQRLSLYSAPELVPPGEAAESRSIKERYREAREKWKAQRDAISDKFDERYNDERTRGVTLSDMQRQSAAADRAHPSGNSDNGYLPDSDQVEIAIGGLALEHNTLSPSHDFALAGRGLSGGREM